MDPYGTKDDKYKVYATRYCKMHQYGILKATEQEATAARLPLMEAIRSASVERL